MLIESDMDYDIIQKAMDGLDDKISRKDLRHRLVSLFEHVEDFTLQIEQPQVVLIIGVNGAGKTTTIAKTCKYVQKKWANQS